MIRDISDTLNVALKELETSKKLSNQLLQEREDSEIEDRVNDRNTQLKSQLVELHKDILDQHHHLRQRVSDFQQCSDTLDQTLKRISGLEAELCKATTKFPKASEQVANTNRIFNELVGSISGLECVKPTISIDLTEEIN